MCNQLVRDGVTHPYTEELSENDYCYAIELIKPHGSVIITRFGVSICYVNGCVKVTNIVPNSLFQHKTCLIESELIQVLDTLEAIGFEGKKYTPEQVDKW